MKNQEKSILGHFEDQVLETIKADLKEGRDPATPVTAEAFESTVNSVLREWAANEKWSEPKPKRKTRPKEACPECGKLRVDLAQHREKVHRLGVGS